MHVSNGRPHMLTSNQRGRGNEPVVVLGKVSPAVAVNMNFLRAHSTQRRPTREAASGAPRRLFFSSGFRAGLNRQRVLQDAGGRPNNAARFVPARELLAATRSQRSRNHGGAILI